MPTTVWEIDSSQAPKGAQQFNRALDTMKRGAGETETRVSSLSSTIGKLAIAGALIAVARTAGEAMRQIVAISDAYGSMLSRLALVEGGQEAAAERFDQLRAAAERAKVPLDQMVDLYSKSAASLRALGADTEAVIRYNETLAKVVKVSGASGASAAAGMYQLNQALVSGKFQGDEFRSVAENLPAVMRLLEKQTGKTAAELRKLASDGKLTGDVLYAAISNAAQGINDDFAKLAPSASASFDLLSAEFLNLAGEMAASEGVSKAWADTFERMREMVSSPEFENAMRAVAAGTADFARAVSDLIDFIEEANIQLQAWGEAIESVTGLFEYLNKGAEQNDAFFKSLAGTTQALGTAAVSAADEAVPALARIREEAEALANAARKAKIEIRGARGSSGFEIDDGGEETAKKLPIKFGAGESDGAAKKAATEAKRRAKELEHAKEVLRNLEMQNQITNAKLAGDTEIAKALEMEMAKRKAVTSEMRKALPELAAQIEAETLLNITLEEQLEARQKAQEELNAVTKEYAETIVSGFAEGIKAGKSFDEVLAGVITRLGDMALEALVLKPLIEGMSAAMSGGMTGGTEGALAGLLGSMAGAGGIKFFADGGVVNGATPFMTRGGLAVAGEAGPEAILPLARGRDGKMGVASTGGGGGSPVSVHITIAGDATDSTVAKMQGIAVQVAEAVVSKRAKGIVGSAVQSVRTEIRRDPAFARR